MAGIAEGGAEDGGGLGFFAEERAVEGAFEMIGSEVAAVDVVGGEAHELHSSEAAGAVEGEQVCRVYLIFGAVLHDDFGKPLAVADFEERQRRHE